MATDSPTAWDGIGRVVFNSQVSPAQPPDSPSRQTSAFTSTHCSVFFIRIWWRWVPMRRFHGPGFQLGGAGRILDVFMLDKSRHLCGVHWWAACLEPRLLRVSFLVARDSARNNRIEGDWRGRPSTWKSVSVARVMLASERPRRSCVDGWEGSVVNAGHQTGTPAIVIYVVFVAMCRGLFAFLLMFWLFCVVNSLMLFSFF